MEPCSKHSNQWPEDEEAMDMEHIRPEDYITLDELDDITDELRYIDIPYEEEEEEYLKQEDTPEELDFNDDRHAGWR